VRILFTFAGGNGHFEPLAPIARATEAVGHTVAFAGQSAMVSMVEAAGFAMFATGGATVGSNPKISELLAVDTEREDRALSEGYAGRTARERASALLALCTEWKPDLLVCDEIDFGAVVVAERLGLPYATVLVIAAGSFVRHSLVAEPLNRLRAEHGLPPDPDLAMLSRYLVLSPFRPAIATQPFRCRPQRMRFVRSHSIPRETPLCQPGSRN